MAMRVEAAKRNFMFIELLRVSWESGDDDDEDVIVKLMEAIDGETIGKWRQRAGGFEQTAVIQNSAGTNGDEAGTV